MSFLCLWPAKFESLKLIWRVTKIGLSSLHANHSSIIGRTVKIYSNRVDSADRQIHISNLLTNGLRCKVRSSSSFETSQLAIP